MISRNSRTISSSLQRTFVALEHAAQHLCLALRPVEIHRPSVTASTSTTPCRAKFNSTDPRGSSFSLSPLIRWRVVVVQRRVNR
jgi:hypothetical protein